MPICNDGDDGQYEDVVWSDVAAGTLYPEGMDALAIARSLISCIAEDVGRK